MELLKQPLGRPLSLHEQVITLCAATHKIFIDVHNVKECQMGLLAYMDKEHPEVGKEIEETKNLTDEMINKIIAAAKEYKEKIR